MQNKLFVSVVAFTLIAAVTAAEAQQKDVKASAKQQREDPVPLRNWPVSFDKVVATPRAASGGLVAAPESLPSSTTSFIAVAPCRAVDTRRPNGAFGGPSFAADSTRSFNIANSGCGVPVAVAYSLNFTIVDYSGGGFLTAYPTGTARPFVSTLNFGSGPALANAAVVPASDLGSIDVYSFGPTNVIIDVNGYFTASSGGAAGTSANTPNTLVLRDGTGSFSAGTITATKVLGAVYQDLAEWVPAGSDLQPGTVVVLDPADGRRVIPSNRAYDSSVAGVVSEQPGILLGQPGENKAQIATTGRVRVLVDADAAPIRVGDLLVTSDITGMAMRSQPLSVNGNAFHRPGTIIGKALEPLASGKHTILVLLSLQ